MKAILEFNLPEETEEYELAMNGSHYLFALQELDNYLRSQLKYNDSLNEEQCYIIESIRTKLHEELNERGVTIHG
jgi:hypothetical protein